MRETHPFFTRRRFIVESSLAFVGAALAGCTPTAGEHTETASAELTQATVAWTNTANATVAWHNVSSATVTWSNQ